jgi:hypothetical protein
MHAVGMRQTKHIKFQHTESQTTITGTSPLQVANLAQQVFCVRSGPIHRVAFFAGRDTMPTSWRTQGIALMEHHSDMLV